MRNLSALPRPRTLADCQEYVDNPFTIFEKIEFSEISKEEILAKIHDLETRQVPQRTVLMTLSDDDVAEHWFKNWLHPMLKHFFKQSPKDKRGCSPEIIARDMQMDNLHFCENGQQNYQYTLDEIKEYCDG